MLRSRSQHPNGFGSQHPKPFGSKLWSLQSCWSCVVWSPVRVQEPRTGAAERAKATQEVGVVDLPHVTDVTDVCSTKEQIFQQNLSGSSVDKPVGVQELDKPVA